ncbi:MAG: cob(I)yrinic acid a,c-diamide adenosyltransferase [Pseudomonadota bacterium]|nr:cob(I)yrinic acid a,c-diamide adenosyltransferase [Pseudomonadota bacterium]
MGHRLSAIATRTGDDGTTGLGDGSRTGKDSLRVDCLGEVDELNAVLGRLLAQRVPAAVSACLGGVQHDLFELGAELCLPGQMRITPAMVVRLDEALAAFNQALAPLKEFILPGGTLAAADAHVARTVCRRVERRLVELVHADGGNPASLQYLNRLSDLLFVLARVLNADAGSGDVLWRPRAPDTA